MKNMFLSFIAIFGMAIISLPTKLSADDVSYDDRIEVRVAGYVYEPFVYKDHSGITQKLLELLNAGQDTYHFTFHEIPARRRYSQIESGRAHIVFFESSKWSWYKYPAIYDITKPFFHVEELLISRVDNRWGTEVFDNLEERKLVIINGYHYAFADFVEKTDELKRRFNIELVHSLDQVLSMLVRDIVDVGVLNDMYLKQKISADRRLQSLLKIDPTPDQAYELSAIVGKKSPINKAELEEIFSKLAIDQDALMKAMGIAEDIDLTVNKK